jgi:hypothetical protein
VPLLVLPIVQVKNWYVITTEKSKTTQKNQVLNLQISMHLKTQKELLDRQKLWNAVEKSSAEKMLYLPVNLKLPFHPN